MAEASTQVERDRMAQKKRDCRTRKRQNDSNTRQAKLDAESQWKAKSRRLAKENLNIKNMEEREALIKKVNEWYQKFIFINTDPFQDS